ncbi:MAG: hypothetical protein K0B14_16600 [Anaerolineaceae bacterium]|nr:hypothetical protein [Anaerolineaceae bacterium]
MASQILRVQVPNGIPFDKLFDTPFFKYTTSSELISVVSVHSGKLTELTYSIGMKESSQIHYKQSGNYKISRRKL